MEQVVTTEGLLELLKEGKKVELVGITTDSEFFEAYDDETKGLVDGHREGLEIVEIIEDGEELTGCIMIGDDDNLYLTRDGMVTHNTSNIIFLKSTDDSLLETLEKMGGTTHKAYRSSKTVTTDVADLLLPTESKVSYTVSTVETPVISYNDLAFLSERNSIVYRAGDSPIWNRNETILPMSWRLFQNTIKQPGYEYSFQTIPTLSSAKDFDVRKNQPDFDQMVVKRIEQAVEAEGSIEAYRDMTEYDDYDIQQLDPDIYAASVMDIINYRISPFDGDGSDMALQANLQEFREQTEVNEEQLAEINNAHMEYEKVSEPKFANKMISPNDLYANGQAVRSLEIPILEAFDEVSHYFYQDSVNFREAADGGLLSSNGETYIYKVDSENDREAMIEAVQDEDSTFYSDDSDMDFDPDSTAGFRVTDAFYKFLSEQDAWSFANGRFEKEMARIMKA